MTVTLVITMTITVEVDVDVDLEVGGKTSGANPTTSINTATGSLARFESYFFLL
jgi:hypothetical protein